MIWNIDYASFRSKSIIAQNNLSKLALMIKEKNWYKNKDSYENIQLVLLNYKYVKGFHELAKEYEKQCNEAYERFSRRRNKALWQTVNGIVNKKI